MTIERVKPRDRDSNLGQFDFWAKLLDKRTTNPRIWLQVEATMGECGPSGRCIIDEPTKTFLAALPGAKHAK
jgi:hypothetical protein